MDVQLDQLRALAAAVDEGTLDAAARRLNVTPSAISQRVKALETTVGRVLMRRGKPISVTESGRAVLSLARHVDLLVADTTTALGVEPDATTTLTLAVNADSLDTWVLPALAAVADRVQFEIHREDEEHTTALLRDGTVMAAITATAEPVQGCSVSALGAMRYRPMASPSFAARWFDAPLTEALTRAPVVVFDRKDDLQDRYLRARLGGPASPPRHYVPASAGYVEAVRLGLGWGMIPVLQSERAPDRFVEFDPRAHIDVPLYWQQWKLPSRTLTAVAESIARTASRELR